MMRYLICVLIVFILSCSKGKTLISDSREDTAMGNFSKICLTRCNDESTYPESKTYKAFCACVCQRMEGNLRVYHPQTIDEVYDLIMQDKMTLSDDQRMSCVESAVK